MGNKTLLLFIGLLFLGACQENAIVELNSSEDGQAAVEKYKKSKTVGWLKMDLFLRPTDQYVARYIQQHPNDSIGLTNVIKEADEMMYFNLGLSVVGKQGKHIENYGIESSFDQSQRIQYLSFNMQHDVYIEQGAHIIPCEMYHFERNYSISPKRTFVVGFPRNKMLADEPVVFVFNSQYFQTGPMKIRFSSQDIFDSTQIEN